MTVFFAVGCLTSLGASIIVIASIYTLDQVLHKLEDENDDRTTET